MTDVEHIKTDFDGGTSEEAEGLGFGFWAKMAGVLLLGGIGCFILLILFTRAVYAWGVLAAFGLLVAIVLLAAWLHDRREIRRAEESL